jgi:hypothetical protein
MPNRVQIGQMECGLPVSDIAPRSGIARSSNWSDDRSEIKVVLLTIALASLLGCSPVASDPARADAVLPSPSAAQGCGDLLARLGRRPVTLEYTGCTSHPNSQGAPLRATYKVDGKHAAAVEAYLVRIAGLHPLKRSCCQWDSAPAGFTGESGAQFMISMTSDETSERGRAGWSKIANFWVNVQMFTKDL